MQTVEGVLQVRPLSPKQRPQLLEIAQALIEQVQYSLEESREAVLQALNEVEVKPAQRRIVEGLKKLLLDRCQFTADEHFDVVALRAQVFDLAAQARRQATGAQPFDRDAVLRAVAEQHGQSPERVEAALFSDLKAAHRLRTFAAPSPEQLLLLYERGQVQAALLRATQLSVTLRGGSPAAYRNLFRSIKFHRLLYRVERLPGQGEGFLIEIEGPHALFSASTRYGLQLAMVVPLLQGFPQWEMRAQLQWGQSRRIQTFVAQGQSQPVVDEPGSGLPEELERLLQRWPQQKSAWTLRLAEDILDVPGLGCSVPDLVFVHTETGQPIYLEALGYWSREAVWRRVDLSGGDAQGRRLKQPIIYAVSERLRVSEAALDGALPAALYVYKGVINPKALLAQVEAVAQRV